jgi:hypothetical protein
MGRRTNQSLCFKNSVFDLLRKPPDFCSSFNKTPVQSHNSPPAPNHFQSPLSRKRLTILATLQKEQKERRTNFHKGLVQPPTHGPGRALDTRFP